VEMGRGIKNGKLMILEHRRNHLIQYRYPHNMNKEHRQSHCSEHTSLLTKECEERFETSLSRYASSHRPGHSMIIYFPKDKKETKETYASPQFVVGT
jgi:hypothetical protein